MVSGKHLKDAIFAGEALLRKEMDFINAINVYPVADADTGTNMYNTIKGIADIIQDREEERADKMAEAIAEAALEAARGNSGTIISQYFWGFSEAIQGKHILTVPDLADAFVEAKEWAYQAVSNPVEGTMLTTMRAAADAAKALRDEKDPLSFANKVYQNALAALERTPEMLAKLGKPKIIDSGAYGYTLILEGFIHAFGGKIDGFRVRGMAAEQESPREDVGTLYCSNFMLDLDDGATAGEIRRAIQPYGDSIVVVGGRGKMKVHIHTDRPDKVRKILEGFGKVVQERIDKIW
ncbi:MAG: DAK2 domain-containing protein [Candidatus Diapherotrites archaeon]|nr:DAK2 domain-containing protein [Candidatus Diapherotrites archaeon]